MLYKKKKCVRIILLSLVFNVFLLNFSPGKKAKGIALVDDIVIIGLALLAAGGVAVVASNEEMRNDIGQKAYETFEPFVDVFDTVNGKMIKFKQDVTWDLVTEGFKYFSTPQQQVKEITFPYTDTIHSSSLGGFYDNGLYGTFSLKKGSKLTLTCGDITTSTKVADKDYTSCEFYIWYSRATNILNFNRFRIEDVDTLTCLLEKSYYADEYTLADEFTIACDGVATGTILTEIPYDGTHVDSSTWTDINSDSYVTVPTDVSIPDTVLTNSSEDLKALDVDVVSSSEVGESDYTGWSWLDSLIRKIIDLLKGIWNGILSIPGAIVNAINGVLDFLKTMVGSIVQGIGALFVPDEFYELDFSPLYVDLKSKFPFCLPWDFYNFVEMFRGNITAPVWEFEIEGWEGPFEVMNGFSFKLDLNDYNWLGAVSRTISLISFCVLLVFLFKKINV